jgi:D-alanyl-D-alanine carboxypeptidase
VSTVLRFPAPANKPFADPIQRRLDRTLQRTLTATSMTGVTAAVLTDSGSWTGAAGNGLRGEPLVPRSTLSFASITETFTAAEVVLLAARGDLDLDARASAYITLPVKDNGATVRELLSMRSGIRDFVPGPQIAAAQSHPDRHWTPERTLLDVPAQVDTPGVVNDHSNTNYLLLGQLIEKVTGSTYAAALHRDLLDGHGLEGIAVQDEDVPHTPRALPQGRSAGGGHYLPSRSLSSLAWSASGIAGDAAAAARWGYLLYGGRLLPPELVATMHPVDDGTGYGLGTEMLRSALTDSGFVGHRGALGPYRSELAVATDRPMAIAVLLTYENNTADPSLVVESLAQVLLGNR